MAFGSLCYFAFGSSMTKPMITEMLPNDTTIVTMKLIFVVSLLFGYALCIYPTNTIIEGWIFKRNDRSLTTYWL